METVQFNTDSLQTYPDSSYDEKDKRTFQPKVNNNHRYKYFRQNHFTAGDDDQFVEFWDTTDEREIHVESDPPVIINDKEQVHTNLSWHRYQDLEYMDIYNTYQYISNKFKKGLFVKIVQGQGKVFLPFSKVDYQNEWSHVIRTNPQHFKNIYELMEYTSKLEKRPFVSNRIHKNTKAWYGNNGLVRFEYPPSEGESGINMIKDMITTVIQERRLPSFEGFINKRDFPLLKKDDTESYDTFFGNSCRLLSYQFQKYAPILSMTTTPSHADIPIPTWEDWCRVQYWHDHRMFGKEYRSFPTPNEMDQISWAMKKPIAVFRGASTGLGTTIHNNIRLRFAWESEKQVVDTDDHLPFFDAGITKWNLRPRKHPQSRYLETILVDRLSISLKPCLSVLEQCQYKYILHLPGHSEAYRLGYELYMGSVILYYPCEYQLWFFQWLQPWVHYIPIASVEDAYEKIKWCKQNDEACQQIARNARQFAHQYLDREPILDYLQTLFWQLHTRTRSIHYWKYTIHSKNKELYTRMTSHIQKQITKHRTQHDTISTCLRFLYNELSDLRTVHPYLIQYLFHTYYPDMISHVKLELVKEGKNTTLYRFEFRKKWFALKRNKLNWKSENQFQNTCSYACINALHLSCPYFNFVYYDCMSSDYHDTISDFIEGNTLEYELMNRRLSLDALIHLYMILSLLLYTAQQKHGFIHMDLYPWNIMIQTLDTEIVYEFRIGDKQYRIPSRYHINIIDYGKSHFLFEEYNYYNSSPFLFCTIQDMISIMFSTLYLYLDTNQCQLSSHDHSKLIDIMNFFTPYEYSSNQFHPNLLKLKWFLKYHKKYNRMLSEPKHGFETFDILTLFQYLKDRSTLYPCIVDKPSELIRHYLYFPFSESQQVFFEQYIKNQCFIVSILHHSEGVAHDLWEEICSQNQQIYTFKHNNSVQPTICQSIYMSSVYRTMMYELSQYSGKFNTTTPSLLTVQLPSLPHSLLEQLLSVPINKPIPLIPMFPSHIYKPYMNSEDMNSEERDIVANDFWELRSIHEYISSKSYKNIFLSMYQLSVLHTIRNLYVKNKE